MFSGCNLFMLIRKVDCDACVAAAAFVLDCLVCCNRVRSYSVMLRQQSSYILQYTNSKIHSSKAVMIIHK